MLNEQLVVLLPLTIYALSCGCAPLPLHIPETTEKWIKVCVCVGMFMVAIRFLEVAQ